MKFTFWCVLPTGKHNSIDTDNLFEAARRARELGAQTCFGRNPGTGRDFAVEV